MQCFFKGFQIFEETARESTNAITQNVSKVPVLQRNLDKSFHDGNKDEMNQMVIIFL